MISSPGAVSRARKERQIASVPHATPMACLTPQNSANSFSKAERLAPFKSRIDEKIFSQRSRSSVSTSRNFLVRSSSGIFIAAGRIDENKLTLGFTSRPRTVFCSNGSRKAPPRCLVTTYFPPAFFFEVSFFLARQYCPWQIHFSQNALKVRVLSR